MCSGQFPDPTERTFVLNLPENEDILQNHAKSRYIWYSSHSWLALHMDQPDSWPIVSSKDSNSVAISAGESAPVEASLASPHPPRPCMTHIHPTCVASGGCSTWCFTLARPMFTHPLNPSLWILIRILHHHVTAQAACNVHMRFMRVQLVVATCQSSRGHCSGTTYCTKGRLNQVPDCRLKNEDVLFRHISSL